jgi:uncharacterized protein YidB (DUF937 family)
MRSKLATAALVGALGLTGVTAAVLVVPAVSYAATGDSTALDDRVAAIKDALAGLVTDGSLTQAQADEVAEVLAEQRLGGHGHGHGGPGGRLDLAAATEALGITADELRAAAEAGSTLSELAEEQGVDEDRLVDALVTAGEERLAQAVTDGRLTQAEADEKAADLEARITERLDQPIGFGRHGHRGGPPFGGPGEPSAEQPSAGPTTAPQSGPA